MKKLITRTAEGGTWLMFWCQAPHKNSVGASWTWNGDREKPTLTPSILAKSETYCCHSFVTDGMIQFLGDCTHEFAGQTVALEAF